MVIILMNTLKVIVLEGLDERPEENYVVFGKLEIKYCYDKQTTLKKFYTDINRILFPGSSSYKPYMFKVFTTDYKKTKCFSDKDSNKDICNLIDLSKPIRLIYYHDYEGAGCWGESNGLRFDIKFNENNHMATPHVHVSYGKNQKARINIINIKVLDNSNKKHELSRKHLKQALKFVKKHQLDFIEMWNDFTLCDMIIDINYFKNTKKLRLVKRTENINLYHRQFQSKKNNKWSEVEDKIIFN